MESERRYRENVGVVVFNAEGRAWLGRRTGGARQHEWQFPQGGVDPGENLEAAARRELREETGLRTVSLLARTREWIAYDFPADVFRAKRARGYHGQKQIWFAFRFDGEDSEVDLTAHLPAEFDAWRWADLHETADLIVPFKRAAYVKMIEAFSPYAAAR